MVVGAGVKGRAVDQQAERGAELLAGTSVLVVFTGEPAVDVGQSCADAVLVALEGLEVDGVGEVRGEGDCCTKR